MVHPAQLAITTAGLATGQVKERIEGLERTFQEGGAPDLSTGQVALLCVLAASLGLLLWRLAKRVAREGRGSYYSTNRLFGQLCRLHRLDWPSRRLLKKLAQARQLDPPTRLFIESSWFDASELPVSLQPFRARLAEIKRRLFGNDEAFPPASKQEWAPASAPQDVP